MKKLKDVISGKELLKSLSPEARKAIEEIPEEKWKKFYKKMRRMELRRLRLLIKREKT